MKPIPRFKTGGIYASHSGKKHYKVNRRTDKTVWVVKVDEKNGDEISTVKQLRIRTMDQPSQYEFTLLPKAFIKATNKVN